jgi:hypothetical protein
MGAQSVLAARNGMPGTISYVPVPVVTVPDPYRPPLPPAPQVPQAPNSNMYVNAFTPPADPNRNAQAAMQQQAPMNPVLANPLVQARYAPPGYGAYPHPAMMQPNPYMASPYMAAQPMPPYAQGPMQPMAGRPVAPLNYPMAYQGPQPPNPFAGQAMQQVTQTQYQPSYPPAYAYPPAGYQPVADPRLAANAELFMIQQRVAVLQQSPYPAQRTWAANELATYNWRAQPHVLQVLLFAARQDPAASVRAGCVYCLGRMNATTEPVVNTLLALKNDPDPAVRHEVEQALNRLGVAPPR